LANLRDLARRLRQEADDIPENVNETTTQVALDLVRELADTTPVDTTEALSNWQIGLGRPVAAAIGPRVPGNFGNTRLPSVRATVAAAREALRTRRPGQSIFVSNVAAHIVSLNAGSSAQAPAGFVEVAVIRARESNGRQN
jgi:hypothetical protein